MKDVRPPLIVLAAPKAPELLNCISVVTPAGVPAEGVVHARVATLAAKVLILRIWFTSDPGVGTSGHLYVTPFCTREI